MLPYMSPKEYEHCLTTTIFIILVHLKFPVWKIAPVATEIVSLSCDQLVTRGLLTTALTIFFCLSGLL
ncbi:hypothetical protein XENTR_v10000844 [Xenopus tropicalis]|nr:hypothetical protein XENTR_v10000844 [Xenopus tropicalis]